MSIITKRRLASLASASALIATLAVAAMPSAALAAPSSTTGRSTSDGYSSIPSKVTGNIPSYGFQAYSIEELGDIVGLGGTAKKLSSMSVVFSSWASESGSWNTGDAVTTPGATFDVPITFNIYANNGGAKGALLATKTKDVAIAYRPSTTASLRRRPLVQLEGQDLLQRHDPDGHDAHDHSDRRSAAGRGHLDRSVQHEHAWPQSDGCVGPRRLAERWSQELLGAPFVGTDLDEDQVFVDSTYLGDGDSGWTGYRPLGAITTK